MPGFNTSAQSFAPAGPTGLINWFVPNPQILTGVVPFTTAQLTAQAAYTSVVCTTGVSTLLEAAKKRTTGITVIVPTDQLAVMLSNNPILGPIVNDTLNYFGTLNVTYVNSTGLGNGCLLAPGNSYFFSPYNDNMYASPSQAASSTVFFLDT